MSRKDHFPNLALEDIVEALNARQRRGGGASVAAGVKGAALKAAAKLGAASAGRRVGAALAKGVEAGAAKLADASEDILVATLLAKQKGIYGTDDRVDVYTLAAGPNRDDADCVVALFKSSDVVDNGDGTSTLTTRRFGTVRKLCSSEPFRDQPVGAFCSGFLVGPDLIATAGHCVDVGDLATTRFVFGFRMKDATTATTRIANSEIYRGTQLVGRGISLDDTDWSLVRIDRPVTNHRIASVRRVGKVRDRQALHVIGHPSGLPAKLAGGAAVRDNQQAPVFVANLDTYGGNSGSPVFNSDTHDVEGILVRGDTDFVRQGDCVVSQVCPDTGCDGEDCTRTTEFSDLIPGSGRLDHLALYRPGTGTIWIVKRGVSGFAPVYQQGAPGNGIGGYDLKSGADRAFPFDYSGSGKPDHLALYRPGTGTIWILRNRGGTFKPVYQQGAPGNGIGGYDLRSGADRAFAFDYASSGKLDHLALYRPGTGTMWILRNNGGTFTPVYRQGDPGTGIGGYDLRSPADQAFAFDYNRSGKLDHLALYRPGTGTIWILRNDRGTFTPVYRQGAPGIGIGGYDLRSPADRAFAFDYDGSGRQDHLALYRPGTGTIWILRNDRGTFTPVYQQGDPGTGIAGYDLKSPADLVVPVCP